MEGLMQGLYLLWFVQERQISPAVVATVLALGDLALIGFEIPTGWFADRFGHRLSLILGSLVQIAGMLWCWLGEGTSALVIASLLVALGDGFRSGADQALLYRSCIAVGCEDAFQRIVARAHAVEQAALFVFVLLGGAIVHVWGFAAGWAAETMLCAIGLVIAWVMAEPPAFAAAPERDAHAVGRFTRAGWTMAVLILPAAFLGAAASAASFLLQTAGTAGAAQISIVVAAITLAEAAGSALAVRLTGARVRTQWILFAAGLMTMGVAVTSGSMLVAAAGLAFLDGVAHPLRSAAIQRAASDGFRARAASAASACDMLLSTLTLPLAGAWRGRR